MGLKRAAVLGRFHVGTGVSFLDFSPLFLALNR